ncbi:MAG TPA: hypothetical protein VF867_04410 [Arthrobacter sp.]
MSEQPRDRIGQYVATVHGEPAVALAAPGMNFGQTQDELNAVPGHMMGPAQVRQWADGEFSHCVSPAIGILRRSAHQGGDLARDLTLLEDAYRKAGTTIARKLGGIVREPAVAPDADDRLERLQLKPGTDMGPEEITDWVVLEFRERLTPLRDRITEDAAAGKDTAGLTREFMATARGFGSDVAAKFRPGPTAEDLA